jgi:hypothetical protein
VQGIAHGGTLMSHVMVFLVGAAFGMVLLLTLAAFTTPG